MKRKLLALGCSCLLACSLVVAPAAGQTIAVSARLGGGLLQQFDVPTGSPFELVVWIDPAGSGSQAVEFAIDDLPTLSPGVLLTGRIYPYGGIYLVEPCEGGACALPFAVCAPAASPLEVVLFSYVDLSGVTGPDVVISPRGLQPGDPFGPSSFDGSPGFVDCDEVLVPLEPGGVPGGVTGADVVFPDGSVVLNPTPLVVSTGAPSLGRLKARFD